MSRRPTRAVKDKKVITRGVKSDVPPKTKNIPKPPQKKPHYAEVPTIHEESPLDMSSFNKGMKIEQDRGMSEADAANTVIDNLMNNPNYYDIEHEESSISGLFGSFGGTKDSAPAVPAPTPPQNSQDIADYYFAPVQQPPPDPTPTNPTPQTYDPNPTDSNIQVDPVAQDTGGRAYGAVPKFNLLHREDTVPESDNSPDVSHNESQLPGVGASTETNSNQSALAGNDPNYPQFGDPNTIPQEDKDLFRMDMSGVLHNEDVSFLAAGGDDDLFNQLPDQKDKQKKQKKK